MQANELRIGNYVLIDGQAQKVEAIIMLCNGFELYVEGIDYDYSLYAEPIPLNEEWLIKLGFRQLEGKSYAIGSACDGYVISDKWDNGNQWSIFISKWRDINYVHQLQNWHHAYCEGQELTITN